jgi:hypothetical protein
MRQGGTRAPAAYGRCLADGGVTPTPLVAPRLSTAGERLSWRWGARLILMLSVGSWGLVGLAVWYVLG